MLHYDRIDISKGIDLAESNNSKGFMTCHYCFFNLGFKFQDPVRNGCHVFIVLIVNISDIAIFTVKNIDYGCMIDNISKSEASDLLENSVLENCGYKLKDVVLTLFR